MILPPVASSGATEIAGPDQQASPSSRAPAIAGEIAVHPAISLEVHGDLAAIEGEWREFEADADYTPFQSFDWLAKWQRHIGAILGVRPAIVVGRSADGSIRFVLPLAVAGQGALRRLVFLAGDRCDYNAPVLSRRWSMPIEDWTRQWPKIVAAVRAATGLHFDIVDLRKMPQTVGGQPNPLLALGVARNSNDSHVASLGAEWESFYKERRSSSSRKVQRKQLNRLKEFGEICFVEATDPAELAKTIDAMSAQKRRALARIGVADMFARPGVADFYGDLIGDPRLAGLVHVSRLDVGAEIAATSIGLLLAGRYHLILSSYNDGPMSRFGPGRAHLMELLARAIGRGVREFDFTIGNEPYKLDWCDTRLPLYDHLSPASAVGRLVAPAMAASAACRRAIRNNKAAWDFFLAARAWFHALARGRKETAGDR
jgi:CelD/BcsL family acetyltransferase involved in cellulose biosynthesis